jgi:hypothetical protein
MVIWCKTVIFSIAWFDVEQPTEYVVDNYYCGPYREDEDRINNLLVLPPRMGMTADHQTWYLEDYDDQRYKRFMNLRNTMMADKVRLTEHYALHLAMVGLHAHELEVMLQLPCVEYALWRPDLYPPINLFLQLENDIQRLCLRFLDWSYLPYFVEYSMRQDAEAFQLDLVPFAIIFWGVIQLMLMDLFLFLWWG